MATLSDILAAVQNGVQAINNFSNALTGLLSTGVAASGNPGGSSGQVEFNNAGAFGGFTLGGDATLVASAGTMTISNGAITYAKIQNVSASPRLLGLTSGAPATVQELTPAAVSSVLSIFTSALQGVAPASPGGSSTFLRADATWNAPAAGGGTVVGPATSVSGDFATWSSSTGTSLSDTSPAAATATLTIFTSIAQGVVPASTGSSTFFLRADATWQPATFNSLKASSFGGLPAASGSSGLVFLCTDSSAASFFGIVSSGNGTNIVPIFSDGTNWRMF